MATPETIGEQQKTEISIQTGVYTGMLVVAAVCMLVAVLLTYLSQAYYTFDASGNLTVPLHEKAREAGLKSEKSSTTAVEKAAEEKPSEEKAAEEKKEEKPAEEKKEEKPAASEEKKEEKPAEEKKEEKKE